MIFRTQKFTKQLKRIAILVVSLSVIFVVFRKHLIYKPYRYYRSTLALTGRVEISLPAKDFNYLDSLRLAVKKTKKVTPLHRIYVKGEILYNNEISKIKIRLKGDQIDHYQSDPPSYRIKVLDEKTVLGTSKLSIHSFGSRNFLSEWIYHKMLEQRDVISLNMDVIELNVNNTKSFYTFEEHFTHFLTDRFDRPQGPIICIDEGLFWSKGAAEQLPSLQNEEKIYYKSPIKKFKYYAELDSNHVKKAKDLLNRYRNKSLKASEVFDIKRLAIFFAISDLTNSHHALRWHNNRFYYNPTSDKLEPIGFDGSSWDPLSVFAYDNEFLKSLRWSELFSDKNFVQTYVNELDRISNENYLNDFFNQYKNDLYNLANRIHMRNRFYSKEVFKNDVFFNNNYKVFYANAEWIRNNLSEYRNRLLNE